MAAAATVPNNTYLQLQTNVPETIALQFSDGLLVTSPKGYADRIMYTLTDGRKLYLPPFVADKVRAAGIQRGEFFTICKREVTQGNRRTVEYQITAPEEALPQTVVPAPVAPTTSTLAVVHSQATPKPEADAVALMKAAGRGAIDAVLDIEEYARQRGMTDFTFGEENVQKIAGCLFIELCKRGGRA
jgi:hypothetical protein